MTVTGPVTVGVLNRFTDGAPYPLGASLERRGLTVVQLDLKALAVSATTGLTGYAAGTPGTTPGPVPGFDVLLWRLSENLLPAVDKIRFAGPDGVETPQVNTLQTLLVCGDKLDTAAVLTSAGIPVVPTYPALPGNVIPAWFVGKPAHGAGGRNILYGVPTGDPQGRVRTIPLNTTESWVIQPDVGDRFIRVLVIGGEIICAYERVHGPDDRVNNVEAGGQRRFLTPSIDVADLALAAAAACGAHIAGIDIALDNAADQPHLAVLEVNASPGFPPEFIDDAADQLGLVLHRAASSNR